MNITSALGLQVPAAPVAPVARSANPKETAEPTPANATTSAQFAALLALLANNNPKLRADLMKQVPAEGVGLLDQLLNGAATGDETNVALDAARYSMLTETGLSGVPAKGTGLSPTNNQSRISAAVLSRIVTRKTSSVEQLLAVGDKSGALARARLDEILATAGTDEGARLAAATALATQLAQSASNTATPVTNTDGLDPDFKQRFDRVVSRMKNESGLDVTIIETVRSQERQDALYAQGRTTPGDVVTWTQDSAHTRGQAVDVMVGGSYNNPDGFALLQKIAREEGLHTLGTIDPGHLEMSKDAQAISAAARALAAANAKVTSVQSNVANANSGIARVATVAQVASVGNASVQNAEPPRVMPSAANNTVTLAPATTHSSDDKGSLSNGTGEKSAGGGSERDLKGASSPGADTSGFVNLSRESGARFIGPSETNSAPAPRVDAADRVQNIDALRDQSAAKPLSQITLDIDGVNGEKQQITVDLRGTTVGTHINTDEVSASRLRSHVNELQGALESRGLQADVVRISGNVRTSDAAEGVRQISAGERDAMRLNGASNSNAGDGTAGQGQRERSSAARDWEDRQAAREEQRRNGRQADHQRPQYQEKQ